MWTPENITRLINQAADAMGVSPGTIGSYAGGSGDFYGRLEAGCDITSRRAARVVQWLSDNWPEDLPWPADIPRPPPSPDSPAAKPPEPVSDPSAVVEAELALVHRAMDDNDFTAYGRHEARMYRAAMTLGDNGQIKCPAALCKALGVARTTYDDVVRRYADGRSDAGKSPREGSSTAKVLALLVESGDVRFSGRRQREAS